MEYKDFKEYCRFRGRYCGVTGKECNKENCPAMNIKEDKKGLPSGGIK